MHRLMDGGAFGERTAWIGIGMDGRSEGVTNLEPCPSGKVKPKALRRAYCVRSLYSLFAWSQKNSQRSLVPWVPIFDRGAYG